MNDNIIEEDKFKFHFIFVFIEFKVESITVYKDLEFKISLLYCNINRSYTTLPYKHPNITPIYIDIVS